MKIATRKTRNGMIVNADKEKEGIVLHHLTKQKAKNIL